MRLIVNFKNTFNQEVFDLFKKNYKDFSPEYQYKRILECDYWFVMYDDKTNDIIAECSVSVENDDVIEINDVFVTEKYRGLRYSELLLMNVLYYFGDTKKKLLIKVSCELDNIPAYRCYNKIFEDPYRKDNRYAYFCLTI
jgi:GNAT superfamily N-acetyltransferase